MCILPSFWFALRWASWQEGRRLDRCWMTVFCKRKKSACIRCWWLYITCWPVPQGPTKGWISWSSRWNSLSLERSSLHRAFIQKSAQHRRNGPHISYWHFFLELINLWFLSSWVLNYSSKIKLQFSDPKYVLLNLLTDTYEWWVIVPMDYFSAYYNTACSCAEGLMIHSVRAGQYKPASV